MYRYVGNSTPSASVAPGIGFRTLRKSFEKISSAIWRSTIDRPKVARMVSSGFRWMRRIRTTSITAPSTNRTPAARGSETQWLQPASCTTNAT